MLTVGELFETLRITEAVLDERSKTLDVWNLHSLTPAELETFGVSRPDEVWSRIVYPALDDAAIALPPPAQLLRWTRCAAGTETIERDDLEGPSTLSLLCHGAPLNTAQAREHAATSSEIEHHPELCETLELLLFKHASADQADCLSALLDLWNEPLRVRLTAAALLAIGDPARPDADHDLAAVVARLGADALLRESRWERFEISAEALATFLRGGKHPRSQDALDHARIRVLRKIRDGHPSSLWHLERIAKVTGNLAFDLESKDEAEQAIAVREEMRTALVALVAADPDNLEHSLGLSAALKGSGGAHEKRGRLDVARALFAEDLALSESIVEASGRAPAMLLGAAVACRNAQRLSKESAQAELLRQRGIAWLRPLVEKRARHPDVAQLWELFGGE